ncbi:hypothetical protein ACLBXO_28485 [Methylobacterium sp. C33D]
MPRRVKKESVSVSFHYLIRRRSDQQGETKIIPFSMADFDHLQENMEDQDPIDFDDQESVDRLRFSSEIILLNLTRENSRTISGTFKNPYSGHAFENTHKGKIPAESVSLRPFHFLLYLSEGGRIYIASQYLGQYGGYIALQNTIQRMLPKYEDIESRTFRSDTLSLKKAEAKEIRVTLSRQSSSIAKYNPFQQDSIVTFKKQSKNDGFETEVSEKIFPYFGRRNADIQKVVADVVNQNELMDVKDTDISDCTIIAKINGRTKTIYMLDDGNFATKFPINVQLDTDGHPDLPQTKNEMIRVLTQGIIAKSENV